MDKKDSARKRRKFDDGFKMEALKMLNSGRSVSEVGVVLGWELMDSMPTYLLILKMLTLKFLSTLKSITTKNAYIQV